MEKQNNPHHLLLGELKDFLTNAVLPDTHDERYRQKIAKLLVQHCGFDKKNIISNIQLSVSADNRTATLKIDFLIHYENKTIIMIKYAPGSLVTRRLSTLALSRLIEPYQIPIVIITNGEDAEILDGDSGKLAAAGLGQFPIKERVKNTFTSFSFKSIGKTKFDQASRIAYACEIDGACPCDTDICVIEP